MTVEARVWQPWPGQQTAFLSSPAFEALYGGQAGPGKSDCILMEALRQITHPLYAARIFRRSFTSLEGANGLIERSRRWFPEFGGTYNGTAHAWRFPSGAMIYLSHMLREDDRFTYQGDEICYLAFDELTEFEERQYTYMLTRVRAPSPDLRAYVRSGANPGNIGHTWVKNRFITRDIVNRIRWFATVDGADMEVDRHHPEALSRVFYPAAMKDNPAADPGYANRIRATGDPILIARLLGGDWDAEYTEGRIFDNWSLENITTEAQYNPDRPVYWGVDDGYVEGQGRGTASYHPRVILFAQDNDIGGVDIIDEYTATGETYDETLDHILGPKDGSTPEFATRWQGYRRPGVAWVDGSAAMLRAELGKRGITTANGTHPVVEGIKNVRRLIRDGNGVIMLRVHPLCTNLIFEMGAYRSDLKARSASGEPLPLKLNDHSIDPTRYLSWHKRWDNSSR